MRPRDRRGSVLVQVLVTSVIMAIIAASIMRMSLQPAVSAASAVSRVTGDLAARGALNRLNETWTRVGSCGSDASAGVACSGAGCSCECVVDSVVVRAVPQGGACSLRIASPEP